MNKDIIKKIQEQIIQLLPDNHQDRMDILLSDSCSEISRLIGGRIKIFDKSDHVLIIKGTNVCGTQKAHDILMVTTANNQIYVIDPTIWQFFPQAKSILVSTSNNLNNALNKIRAIYGGQWSESEKIITMDANEEKQYLDIISRNIHENLKQLNQ